MRSNVQMNPKLLICDDKELSINMLQVKDNNSLFHLV